MLSLVASLFVGGTNAAFAQYEESFENGTNGWACKAESPYNVTSVGTDWGYVGNLNNYWLSGNYKQTGNSGLFSRDNEGNDLIITPRLASGNISFYARSASDSGSETITFYTCDSNGENLVEVWANKGGARGDVGKSRMKQFSFMLEEDAYLAISLVGIGIDDFVAENGLAAEGAVAKPKNVAANDITFNSANLTWDAVEGATYQVVYSTEADFNADEVAANNAESNSYAMTGLNPETTYYVCVRAKVGEEVSAWTKAISFTTAVQFPAPTAFAVADYSETSATFQWTAGSTESAWQIAYSTDADFNADEATPVAVTENPYTLTGLTAETTYYVCLRANYGDGFSKWTEKVSVKPTAAKDLTVNDGTVTNSYVPVYGMYVDDLTRSQFILPASTLESIADRKITKLVFHSNSESIDWGKASFEVYVSEVDNETFANANLVDWSSMTKVYEGALSISNNQMVVEFNDEYEYGGGNLLIGFNQTVEGTYKTSNWYGVGASGSSLGGYGSSVSQQNFLPKVTITSLPGSSVPAPKLKVNTKAYDFGLISEAATMTFNIKNSGKAELTNIEVVSDNDAYTIENAPTTLAAGADQNVTVTLNVNKFDEQPATITISADGFEGENAATIAMSGTVMNPDKFFEDFNAGEQPAGWRFDDGAVVKNNAAYVNSYNNLNSATL